MARHPAQKRTRNGLSLTAASASSAVIFARESVSDIAVGIDGKIDRRSESTYSFSCLSAGEHYDF